MVEVFQTFSMLTDDQNLGLKILSNYNVVFFVNKSKQKRLPFMCIPLRNMLTEEIFADEVQKVEYCASENGENFLKFSLKTDSNRMCLKLVISKRLVSRFMAIWSDFLPLKKKPSSLDVDRRSYRTDLVMDRMITQMQKEAFIKSNERNCVRYSLYANFMREQVPLKKKEIIKKLKEEECKNLPKFISTYSDQSNHRFWLGEAVKYAVDHNCNNDGTDKLMFGIWSEQDKENRCDGYSLLKCVRCKLARYCSVRCQNEHFALHSAQQCDDWKIKNESLNYVGESLTNIVHRAHSGPVVDRYSYEDFLSLISSRIFLATFNFFKDHHFRERVFCEFKKCGWSQANTDRYQNLLKSEPLSAREIKRQLEEVWGPEPLLDIYDDNLEV